MRFVLVLAAIVLARACAAGEESATQPSQPGEATVGDAVAALKEYLERWTPGGDANSDDLPYPQVTHAYQSEGEDDWRDDRWQLSEKGPFLSHSILLPKHEVGPKVTAVAAGAGKFWLYDLEAGSFIAGVTAGEVRTDPARFGLLNRPVLAGDVAFYRPAGAMWRQGQRQASVPSGSIDYQGLHLSDDRVLLVSRIAGAEVLESPLSAGDAGAVVVEIELGPHASPMWLTLAVGDKVEIAADDRGAVWTDDVGTRRAVALDAASARVKLERDAATILLHWPATESTTSARVSYRPADAGGDRGDRGAALNRGGVRRPAPGAGTPRLAVLKRAGDRRWGEPLATTGALAAASDAPFVVDRIDPPRDNPFHALFFIAGLDFFPNGAAAVSTAHGDVWIVRGLDDSLRHVTWQRFATGLYQPLGLEVVDGKVIVLGRDQLTRLHDENGDGEADFYESFNHDLIDQGLPHAYAMRLERTSDGSFVFVKSGEGPHGSAVLRVSADGGQLEVLARGFRHPFGLGAGPNGDVTVADNEGNWVPSSKIDLIAPGGFYGFLGSAAEQGDHSGPARPLCYIPKVADNSCGGQFWHTSDPWGPYHRGGMFHFSWGRCTLHAVLEQAVGAVRQAATVEIPGVVLQSGPAEAEFHPRDGQLYVVGLDGWQTAAEVDGSFERIRHTGRPVRLPSSFAVHEDAIVLGFDEPLDASSLQGENSVHVEQWNYQWRPEYGSYHFSVKHPERVGHDVLTIDEASLSPDGRQLRLSIAGLRPVDQIQISLDVRAADGAAIRTNVYGTINALAK